MGRKELDEKQLLSDLSKFIGAAKAAMKAARNVKRAAKTTAAAAPSSSSSSPGGPTGDKKKAKVAGKAGNVDGLARSAASAKKVRRAKRKAAAGGTIRITLKGGYSVLNRGVPGALDEALEQRRAAFRAAKSVEAHQRRAAAAAREHDEHAAAVEEARRERQRQAAAAAAEAAAEAAAARAADEGEDEADVDVDAEVDAEVEEDEQEPAFESSHAAARPPVGMHFAKLVAATGGEIVRIAPLPAAEDSANDLSPDEYASFFFAPRENVATKCIVKIKGPRGAKATATLASQKSVNYFKTNFGQLVRKELGGIAGSGGGGGDGNSGAGASSASGSPSGSKRK